MIQRKNTPSSSEGEKTAFAQIQDKVKAFMETENIPENLLQLRPRVGYSAITFGTLTLCLVKIRARSSYFEFAEFLEPQVKDIRTKYDAATHYSRVPCELAFGQIVAPANFDTLLQSIMEAAFVFYPKEFDCCSRYLQCSDAKRCVDPDGLHAMGCGYRRIMRKGRYFYGINRNV